MRFFAGTVFFLLIAIFAGASAQANGAGAVKVLAVMDLKGIGVSNSIAEAVSEIVRTEFVEVKEYQVIERAMISKVLDEQKLGLSGVTDDATAVKIGKLLGANYTLVGSVVKLGNTYTINARLVVVETGVAEDAQSVSCDSLDALSGACMDLVEKIKWHGKPPVTNRRQTVKNNTVEEQSMVLENAQTNEQTNANDPVNLVLDAIGKNVKGPLVFPTSNNAVRRVIFYYIPQTAGKNDKVTMASSWNGWCDQMKKVGEPRFQFRFVPDKKIYVKQVLLKKGIYLYHYILNLKQAVPDPSNPVQEKGKNNAVLSVLVVK